MTHVVLLLRGAAFLSVGNAQWLIIDMMEFKVPFEETTSLYLNCYNKTLKKFRTDPSTKKAHSYMLLYAKKSTKCEKSNNLI